MGVCSRENDSGLQRYKYTSQKISLKKWGFTLVQNLEVCHCFNLWYFISQNIALQSLFNYNNDFGITL